MYFFQGQFWQDETVRGLVLGLQENHSNTTMNTSFLKSVSPLYNRLQDITYFFNSQLFLQIVDLRLRRRFLSSDTLWA